MEETHLYRRIAGSLRREILQGSLRPGDRLPSVREASAHWQCTAGTVHRAYRELAQQGLVVSRAGQGTHVAGGVGAQGEIPLRWANLVHRAETFLLEVLTAGHTPAEAEQAVRLALDRWRALADRPPRPSGDTLVFVGSHDPAVSLIASRFAEVVSGYELRVTFVGSLAGLMALARGEADVAGSHLWDEESDTYNVPFVRRLLPGRRVALLTLAERHLGFIVAAGNPHRIAGLSDLAQPGLRFINRQRGSGTRVWLDAQLHRHGVSAERIAGYENEAATHTEVAQSVAEGRADVGLGVETAALDYGLDFVRLTTERYDLIVPAERWQHPPVQALASWLATDEAKAAIAALGGYEVVATGRVAWVD